MTKSQIIADCIKNGYFEGEVSSQCGTIEAIAHYTRDDNKCSYFIHNCNKFLAILYMGNNFHVFLEMFVVCNDL